MKFIRQITVCAALFSLGAVGALGQPEAHHRHVEHGGVAALVVLGAESQHVLDGYAGGRAGFTDVRVRTSVVWVLLLVLGSWARRGSRLETCGIRSTA